jgi:polysaccharide pyruvyl transferase WcaK-like protein
MRLIFLQFILILQLLLNISFFIVKGGKINQLITSAIVKFKVLIFSSIYDILVKIIIIKRDKLRSAGGKFMF